MDRQTRIASLLDQFRPKAKAQEEWNKQKEAYLTEKEHVDTLTAAQMFLKLLEAYDKEYESSKTRIEKLNALGQQIIDLKAKESDEVREKLNSIDSQRKNLEHLAEEKKKQLLEELAREQKKEALRKEFASQAKDFNRWVKDTVENISGYSFGDTLEAVQNYASTLANSDKEITEQANEKKNKLDNVWAEMQELGVKDNKYTPLTIENMNNSNNNLNESLEKRRTAYAEELRRQEIMEAKRKEVAAAFAAFSEWLVNERSAIDALEGEPEPLTAAINAYHQDGAKAVPKLEELAKLDGEAKSLGITENPHTKYTLPILESENRKHNNYGANYLAELAEEQRVKKDFDSRVKQLVDWVNETIPELEKREFDNTLPGIQVCNQASL